MSFEDSFSLIDEQELMSGEGDLTLGEDKNKSSWSEDDADDKFGTEDSNIGRAMDTDVVVPTEENNLEEKDQDDSDEDGDAEGTENREQDGIYTTVIVG